MQTHSDGVPAEAVANQIVYENIWLSNDGKNTADETRKQHNVPLKANNKENRNENQKIMNPFFLHEKEKLLYAARGLKLGYCDEISNFIEPCDRNLYENLYKLENRTYYLSFSMGEQAHAIGYIKHPDGTAHIF